MPQALHSPSPLIQFSRCETSPLVARGCALDIPYKLSKGYGIARAWIGCVGVGFRLTVLLPDNCGDGSHYYSTTRYAPCQGLLPDFPVINASKREMS